MFTPLITAPMSAINVFELQRKEIDRRSHSTAGSSAARHTNHHGKVTKVHVTCSAAVERKNKHTQSRKKHTRSPCSRIPPQVTSTGTRPTTTKTYTHRIQLPQANTRLEHTSAGSTSRRRRSFGAPHPQYVCGDMACFNFRPRPPSLTTPPLSTIGLAGGDGMYPPEAPYDGGAALYPVYPVYPVPLASAGS